MHLFNFILNRKLYSRIFSNLDVKSLLGIIFGGVLISAILTASVRIPTLAVTTNEAGVRQVDEDTIVYLPMVSRDIPEPPAPLPSTRVINAPYFEDQISFSRSAIAWFGNMSEVDNYTDIRVGYNDKELEVSLSVLDQFLFFDQTPSASELKDWDAVTMYISLDQNPGDSLTQSEYMFIGQVNHWQPREDYQAAYQGNGSNWTLSNIPFETVTMWRGSGFNDLTMPSKGWGITFRIPYSSLGLQNAPHNANWRLGFAVHDRDDPTGSPISDKIWPETTLQTNPDSWGLLHYGIPVHTPLSNDYDAITVIRNGFDGVSVEDAHVGGGFECGGDVNYWTEWPNLNYSSSEPSQVNIQNQRDVSDYPCFSKLFITFPLDMIPDGAEIISATLTMHQFGNSGTGWDDEPQASYIQVLSIDQGWNPSNITWNNAPYASANYGGLRVEPLPSFPGWPGIPRTWNISRAVYDALQAGDQLQLVLYSSDAPIHSGKYFYSSDSNSDGSARPYVTVYWDYP